MSLQCIGIKVRWQNHANLVNLGTVTSIAIFSEPSFAVAQSLEYALRPCRGPDPYKIQDDCRFLFDFGLPSRKFQVR